MTPDDFQTLPELAKHQFLALLSYELTILARVYSSDELQPPELAQRLYGLSEVHHRISSQLALYLLGHEESVIAADFLTMLRSTASTYGITDRFDYAVGSAARLASSD